MSAATTKVKCPDGSECTGQGWKCCDRPSPLSGAYTCVPPGKTCCFGNTQCDLTKERCVGSAKTGGVCAPKCKLAYGVNWKDCGPICCQPHERCTDDVNGKCVSCEQEGKQTCRSYDKYGSAVACCPQTRGSFSPCCASLTTAVCCGPKQQCKAQSAKKAQCICKPGEGKKCGPDCCRKNERCCDGKRCCDGGDICCDGECCDIGTELCYVVGTVRGCVKTKQCKAPDFRCGLHCCGPGMRCRKRKGRNVCV